MIDILLIKNMQHKSFRSILQWALLICSHWKVSMPKFLGTELITFLWHGDVAWCGVAFVRAHSRALIYERHHDSFTFPPVNKSEGIWRIGIGMNAETVSLTSERSGSPDDDVYSSVSYLRSYCTRKCTLATHTISGIIYRPHALVFLLRYTCGRWLMNR